MRGVGVGVEAWEDAATTGLRLGPTDVHFKHGLRIMKLASAAVRVLARWLIPLPLPLPGLP